MEKITWADYMRNEKVLQNVKKERNILQKIKRHVTKLIGHILRRNYFLKHVFERKIEG